jgi:hypothetical protein
MPAKKNPRFDPQAAHRPRFDSAGSAASEAIRSPAVENFIALVLESKRAPYIHPRNSRPVNNLVADLRRQFHAALLCFEESVWALPAELPPAPERPTATVTRLVPPFHPRKKES